ncbi:MAG: hypothetical protein H6738_12125 [Alphaproteobacteria bacterium]|nr:hypothetical protein [Alphaproteobacteria bacterium]MCB9697519.1 hypothetical protein [Alphaproteobacteria bacterium]
MRHRVPFATVVVASLACGGLGEQQPPPDTDGVPSVPAEAEPTPGVVVSSLVPEDESCLWRAARFPGGEDVGALVQLGGLDCPETWVGSASGDRAVLLWATGGALRLGDATTRLPAPPVVPEAVGLDGEVPVMCARIDAELVEDDGETPRHFQVGSDAVEAETEDAVARSWRLVDGAWTEGAFAPVHTAGVPHPCAALPKFPREGVASGPPVQAEQEASGAEGADAEQLEALDPVSWAVAAGGQVALHREAVESGFVDGPPVAWRVGGGDWALVDGVEGAVVQVRGPWLFVSTKARSRLLDARTGEEAWFSPGWGVLVPDDVVGREREPSTDLEEELREPEAAASTSPEPAVAAPAPAAPAPTPASSSPPAMRAKAPGAMRPGTKAKVKRVQPVPH